MDNTNNTITSEKLKPVDQINLPQNVPDTTIPGMQGAIDAQSMQNSAQAQQDNLIKQEQAKKSEAESLSSKYMKELLNQQDTVSNIASEQNRTAEDQARLQAGEYQAQIDQEALSARRKVDELRANNPQGLYGGALQDEMQRIQRDSLSKQADLSLLQNAAQNRFGNLKAINDRAIELRTAKEKNNLDRLTFIYNENKDKLSKADQRVYENLRDKAKQEYDRKLKTEEDIAKVKIEAAKNGAPLSVLQNIGKAKNINQAIDAVGQYMRDPLDVQLKRAQIAKAYNDAKKTDISSGNLSEQSLKAIDASPQGKKLNTLSTLYQKSQTYKNLVSLYGFKAVGAEKALIDNAYADLQISYKEAANLGALTGPDVGLIQNAIKPAAGVTNFIEYALSGGQGGVVGAVDSGLKKVKQEALTNYKQLTSRRPEYRGSDYVNSMITPFAKDYNDVDLKTVEAGEIIQTDAGLLESLGNGQFSPL